MGTYFLVRLRFISKLGKGTVGQKVDVTFSIGSEIQWNIGGPDSVRNGARARQGRREVAFHLQGVFISWGNLFDGPSQIS